MRCPEQPLAVFVPIRRHRKRLLVPGRLGERLRRRVQQVLARVPGEVNRQNVRDREDMPRPSPTLSSMLRILVAASHLQSWGHGVARPQQPSLWPLFLQPCTRPSRRTPRRLLVVPLIADKRDYGESPVGLRRCERAVGDAVPPPLPRKWRFSSSVVSPAAWGVPPKTARNPPFRRKRLMESMLLPPPPPFDRPATR